MCCLPLTHRRQDAPACLPAPVAACSPSPVPSFHPTAAPSPTHARPTLSSRPSSSSEAASAWPPTPAWNVLASLAPVAAVVAVVAALPLLRLEVAAAFRMRRSCSRGRGGLVQAVGQGRVDSRYGCLTGAAPLRQQTQRCQRAHTCGDPGPHLLPRHLEGLAEQLQGALVHPHLQLQLAAGVVDSAGGPGGAGRRGDAGRRGVSRGAWDGMDSQSTTGRRRQQEMQPLAAGGAERCRSEVRDADACTPYGRTAPTQAPTWLRCRECT